MEWDVIGQNAPAGQTVPSRYDRLSSLYLDFVGGFEGVLWNWHVSCELLHRSASEHGIVMPTARTR
jgi:hypothetical protein